MFEEDHDHCSDCSCFAPENPYAGQYLARVCVWDEIDCVDTGCFETAVGVILNAIPRGDGTCHEVEFNIPFAESEIAIGI